MCGTGDLFVPVHDEQFDLILFNPPFLRETRATIAIRHGDQATWPSDSRTVWVPTSSPGLGTSTAIYVW